MITEYPAPKLPPWNEVMVITKSRRNISRKGREMDIPALKVIEPGNNGFVRMVNY